MPAPENSGESPRTHRRTFGLSGEVAGALRADYHSRIVEEICQRGHTLEAGGMAIRLAREFGFCYGVDRAVDLAYETVERFAGRRVFITAEIIHNPQVNQRLREMGVRFLAASPEEGETFDDLRSNDVAILPAFGVPAEKQALLEAKGCVIVDTTCGSVMRVWKRVEGNARDGFTSVIHGAFSHEETIATCSRALAAGGQYIIVRDEAEAALVCEAIEGRADPDSFLRLFEAACSPGFDPERDLRRLGLANQTTMLSEQSLNIGRMLREAMLRRYGAEHVESHFRAFDTVCTATQDRQDAVAELARTRPDLILVVGGFNSSNTGHLRRIAADFAPAFHIDGPDCLISASEIRHKPSSQTEPAIAREWLPAGPLSIGLTAGASTPNRVTGEVIERLLALRGIEPPDWMRQGSAE
ncbi:MAG: 4-hydroxy-3-methylbut-2-enyl diphosphate reductase [candidate division BRC1 bacterium ADurb.BinA364]|nr:MAG: 4-hydroxy-3-methylbut-2-enyl diphosphate reductase [candidate division BRC1 bacterium ADurb.BinA364]